jgi:branched-chain amino acid transport system permease protein
MTTATIAGGSRFNLAKLKGGTGLLAAVGVLLLILLVPPIIDNGTQLFLQRIFDSLTNAGTYAVVAIALVLIFKATTLVNFAQANMAMFGTYVAWWIGGKSEKSVVWVWFGIVAAVVLSALMGALIERVLIRPFDPNDHLPVVLITFGVAAILEAFAGGFFGLEFHPFKSPFPSAPDDRFLIGNASLRYETLGTLLILGLMLLLVFAILNRTKVGLAFRAVSSNTESARLVGVRTGRTLLFGWALAAGLGTLGGALVANDVNLEPAFMARLTIFAFAAATLGGLDSIGGAVIGSFIVAIIQSLMVGYAREVPGMGWLTSNFALVIAFVVILVVLLFKPSGLFGTRRIERV